MRPMRLSEIENLTVIMQIIPTKARCRSESGAHRLSTFGMAPPS